MWGSPRSGSAPGLTPFPHSVWSLGCILPSSMALESLPEEGTVAVVVRVRPPTACERERAAHTVLHVVDQHILVFDPEEPSGPPGAVLPSRGAKNRGKDLKFVFDRVFGEGATQEEVFQHTTREVLDSVLNGYNCSGKAWPPPPSHLLLSRARMWPSCCRSPHGASPRGQVAAALFSHLEFLVLVGYPEQLERDWIVRQRCRSKEP